MFKHLSTEVVLAIHEEALKAHGGSSGLRDIALLESAVAAPQATFGGKPIMADTLEIGAAYLNFLGKNRPFIDGNKRTALASCLVFLSENGCLPHESLDVDDWEKLGLDFAPSPIKPTPPTERLRALLT